MEVRLRSAQDDLIRVLVARNFVFYRWPQEGSLSSPAVLEDR